MAKIGPSPATRASAWFLIFGPPTLFVVAAGAASHFGDIPYHYFSRDLAETLGAWHPLLGVQSNLGALLWCASAAVSLFAGAVLRHAGVRRESSFFLATGAFLGWLLIDDFFLFHDDLAQRYFGIPELAVLCLYIVAAIVYVAAFYRIVLASEWPLLLASLVCLGLGMVDDIMWDIPSLREFRWSIFWEDAFKLLGITGWGGYMVRTCYGALVSRLTQSNEVGP